MSGINFLGAASGLPLDDLVSTLVKTERDSKLSRITSARQRLDASVSGLGQLKSALSAFQDAVKKLGGNSIKARVATVTQPNDSKTSIEAQASSSAVPGSFDVKVSQLARGSRLESADLAFSSADDVVSSSDGVLTFTSGDKSFDVTVTAGMTLNQLRQAINNNSDNFGVNVNIVNAGGDVGTKLVMNSTVTGDGNDLVVSNNNADLDGVSTVPTGPLAGLTTVQSAQNAIIEIDGIVATNDTNTFDNVIQDVSITARAETPDGANAGLTIATDKKGVEDKIKAFMDSYNNLVNRINDLTRPRKLGPDGKTVTAEGGALVGDSLPRGILTQIRGILGGSFPDASEDRNTLFSVGITFDKDGKLQISNSREFGDESGRDRLNKVLENNFDDLAKLFGGDTGVSKQLDNFVKEFNQSGGIIAAKESSLRDQLTKNAKDREAADRYIKSFEETLRKRYSALDSLLGQMQNMSAAVSAQLASLPKFSTNKSR